ncbi:MAG TPA: YceD family protein [Pseudomonadales bacterium]
MLSTPFPERIDAVKMFAREGTITAELALARLQRLIEQLASDQGTVAVDLRFGRDEEGRRVLAGTLDSTVKAACQRCLQEMDLDLHSSLSLFVVDTEEELQELRDDQDGVVMPEDGNLDVLALIEDELLLSLPMIPMHEDPACNQVLNALRQGGVAGEAVAESRPNPFAVLAGLKSAAGAAEKVKEKGREEKGREEKASNKKASDKRKTAQESQGSDPKPAGPDRKPGRNKQDS